MPIYIAQEGIHMDPTGDHEIHEHDFVQDDKAKYIKTPWLVHMRKNSGS